MCFRDEQRPHAQAACGGTCQLQHLCLSICHGARLLPAAGAVGVQVLQQRLYDTLPGLWLHRGGASSASPALLKTSDT